MSPRPVYTRSWPLTSVGELGLAPGQPAARRRGVPVCCTGFQWGRCQPLLMARVLGPSAMRRDLGIARDVEHSIRRGERFPAPLPPAERCEWCERYEIW